MTTLERKEQNTDWVDNIWNRIYTPYIGHFDDVDQFENTIDVPQLVTELKRLSPFEKQYLSNKLVTELKSGIENGIKIYNDTSEYLDLSYLIEYFNLLIFFFLKAKVLTRTDMEKIVKIMNTCLVTTNKYNKNGSIKKMIKKYIQDEEKMMAHMILRRGNILPEELRQHIGEYLDPLSREDENIGEFTFGNKKKKSRKKSKRRSKRRKKSKKRSRKRKCKYGVMCKKKPGRKKSR